jgi:hypothetical protein
MTFFPAVERWMVPSAALRESLAEMRRDGVRGNEGVALWLGRRLDGEARVEHLVFLRGSLVEKKPNQLTIDSRLMNDVTDFCIEKALTLVGQIHSHGPWVGTDLSWVDHRYGVHADYFLSVVAPDFAENPETTITECGVHVFEPQMGYRRLANDEIADRIHLADGPVGFSVVGEERS